MLRYTRDTQNKYLAIYFFLLFFLRFFDMKRS
jgi:hypothetical protein